MFKCINKIFSLLEIKFYDRTQNDKLKPETQ